MPRKRSGEEVRTALRVGRSPLEWILAIGKAPRVIPIYGKLCSVRSASERSENAAGSLSQHPAKPAGGEVPCRLNVIEHGGGRSGVNGRTAVYEDQNQTITRTPIPLSNPPNRMIPQGDSNMERIASRCAGCDALKEKRLQLRLH